MATDADALENEQPETPEIENEEPEAEELEASFEGEEPAAAAPEGESDSAPIRQLRERNRELTREVTELRKTAPVPMVADPGPEPVWEKDEDGEKYEWDQTKFTAAWRAWHTKNEAFQNVQRQQEEVTRSHQQAYLSQRAAQPIPGIDDAEKRVFAEVDTMTQNALIRAKNPALIAALDKHPEKLAALAAITDPVEMLMMIGELRGKAKIMPKGRSAPAPMDIPRGTGSINHSGQNKALEKMEKDLEGGGDRSKLRQARKAAGVVVNKL